MISSVFFDLDGTLADTAPDLAAALNKILQEQDKPALSLETIKPSVSLGGNAMIKMAFTIEEDDPEFDDIRRRFLEIYHERLHQDTYVFPGIEKVLNYLEDKNMIWGVVTNKPEWLTNPVMEQLKLTQRAACIISGDTTEYKKPHPGPMLHACEVAKCNPETSLYVGDALRDIEAGRAAGMKTLTADYGYVAKDENPNEWNADGNISTPEEIIDWLIKENANS
ncbi:MAG: HAD-IA family hydrolase [Gammaproteobacteria bacterium]|nr:HAD-IA family hydrolase [Gammaproteobacteria bacterium]